MHQAYNTIFSSQCRQGRIHKHHLPENDFLDDIFNKLSKFFYKKTSHCFLLKECIFEKYSVFSSLTVALDRGVLE